MRALLVATLLLCVGTPAHAEEVAKDADARRLVASAQLHFDLGEYAAAVDDFRSAYRTTPRPGLLYNLGQAYRLAGDCENARTMYRNYLKAEPRTPYRALVKQHLSSLRSCDEPERPDRGHARRRLGLGIGVAGIAMIAIAVGIRSEPLGFAGAATTGAGGAMYLSWRF